MRTDHFFGYAALAAVVALAVGSIAPPAVADDFNAPLVECNAVTDPAKPSTCASPQDPLSSGRAHIASDGDVSVSVNGAVGGGSYAVVFRSPDGLSSVPVGTLNTNGSGNGSLSVKVAFSLMPRSVGAGNLVLMRNGGDQFVTGLNISHRAEFGATLVTCSAVNVPAALKNCPTDPLTSGSVHVESDDGDVEIHVRRAFAHTTYAAVLRAANGSEDSLGTFGTDGNGNGDLEVSSHFAPGTNGSGTVVLKDGSSDAFLSGFSVTQKPPPATTYRVDLSRCLDVDIPSLHGCGTDPLSSGFAMVDSNGKLSVSLNGAAASTNYEVFFRPADNSGDADTGLAIKTNSKGKGSGSLSGFKPSGTVGSGNFVVKFLAPPATPLDEFDTSFRVK